MKNYGKILIALGCGALIGAAAGILFAPDKGSVTRKKIVDKANDLSGELKKMKDKYAGKSKVPHNGRTGVENEINEYVS